MSSSLRTPRLALIVYVQGFRGLGGKRVKYCFAFSDSNQPIVSESILPTQAQYELLPEGPEGRRKRSLSSETQYLLQTGTSSPQWMKLLYTANMY